ncbi:hypothetical protein [Sulfurimonas sp. HSL3-7]|uniref:hypothetical protein n=1 Tax=Sulfonitrofixus jiaomeiensis TaxID=3131938 RepID=UPI0031FA3EE7
MVKTALALYFLVAASLGNEVNLHSPTAAVASYYAAMNEGNLTALEQTMVRDSYDLDVQVYALSIAFQDKTFRTILKQYKESPEAREIVKKEVEKKLRNRPDKTPASLRVMATDDARALVRFTEEGKPKQLYLSRHNGFWKIDYKAGRKRH